MNGEAPPPVGAPWRDAIAVSGVALLARLAVVLWAWERIPPVADGAYYHTVAQRIAAGQGYTWAWPDGAVTFAAHYPVGYPAMVGALYAVFGPAPGVAMALNACIGALGVLAAHRLAATVAGRTGALLGALAVALHPALVAYTAALMTEAVVASLLLVAGGVAVVARRSDGHRSTALRWLLGAVLGVAILVRPQCVLMAPWVGALASPLLGGWRAAVRAAVGVTGVALLVVTPWTLRNCFRMDAAAPGRFSADACVFVSANGGWNLLIGAAPDATGTWIPIEGARVPVECREVFGEVEKDRCFGRAGARWVMRDPVRWLGLLPAKLGGTFDGCGAASYYLHAANPREFGERAGRWLDVAETLWQRAVLLLGLVAVWRARPAAVPRGLATRGLAAVLVAAALAAVTRPAWIGYVGLCVAAGLVGRHLARHPPLWLAASVVGTTGLAHAVFFGAGRYSMVTFGLLGALAGTALAPRSRGLDGRGDAGARERAMF